MTTDITGLTASAVRNIARELERSLIMAAKQRRPSHPYPDLEIGSVFNTKFESGCVSMSKPDPVCGEFTGFDSTGTLVTFSTKQIYQITRVYGDIAAFVGMSH